VLTRRTDALERELHALVTAHRPRLLAETGCGALTAALLIGRTAGAQRFPRDASFARQTGTAPIPCSSGQRHRHRLDRGGDRQLNHALHIIAITRARHDPATRAYLARKEAEGKGKGSTPLPQAAPRAPLPSPPLAPGPGPATRSEHRRPRAPCRTPTGR
jgi:transposase